MRLSGTENLINLTWSNYVDSKLKLLFCWLILVAAVFQTECDGFDLWVEKKFNLKEYLNICGRQFWKMLHSNKI